MANAQVLYAESVAATTCNSTTWVDLASIPAASFTANKTYLILANQIADLSGTATNDLRVRLVHGTTPTVFDDATLSSENSGGTQMHENSYMFLYTQPGTTELVKLQFSTSSTNTGTNHLSQIIAIKLSDDFTSGADYFWNEFLTDYTMTATPTAKAITASFTPNGTDRWLFIGHMIHDVVGITTQIGFELYDSVAGVLNQTSQEGEDATNDIFGHNLFWVGVPTNAARTLAVRPWNSGSAIMLASRVIAINLAKFAQSASAYSASEVDPATSPTFTNVATVSPNPTNTGDWVYIAFSNVDVNETSSDFRSRLQVNPDGGGLVSDPNYTAGPPGIDNWDATDEPPQNVFKLRSLTSGAGRSINWDWTQVAGTTGMIEDNGIVAFSVELPSSATPISGSDTASISATEGIPTVAGSSSQTDSPTISIGESVAIDGSSSQSDTLTLSVVDTSAIASSSEQSDTVTISITESAEVVVVEFISGSDNATLSITETAEIIVSVSVSDSVAISTTENAPTLDVSLSVVDNASIAIAETVTLASATTVTDILSIGVADASNVDFGSGDKSASDTLTVSVAEDIPNIQTTSNQVDSISVAIAESVSIAGTGDLTDAVTISISEIVSVVIPFDLSDVLSISLTETVVIVPIAADAIKVPLTLFPRSTVFALNTRDLDLTARTRVNAFTLESL